MSQALLVRSNIEDRPWPPGDHISRSVISEEESGGHADDMGSPVKGCRVMAER